VPGQIRQLQRRNRKWVHTCQVSSENDLVKHRVAWVDGVDPPRDPRPLKCLP
jgi:hypothetical protein